MAANHQFQQDACATTTKRCNDRIDQHCHHQISVNASPLHPNAIVTVVLDRSASISAATPPSNQRQHIATATDRRCNHRIGSACIVPRAKLTIKATVYRPALPPSDFAPTHCRCNPSLLQPSYQRCNATIKSAPTHHR